MLRFLKIENLALIDHLEVEFGTGLNLITGETGSGKSILVDAVGLLLGERASQETIRQGFERARVEGLFEVEEGHPLQDLLEESGLGARESTLVVRREISRQAPNKVFINESLTTQRFLLKAAALLGDVHGQHDQQQLLKPAFQLDYLDAFGENFDLLSRVSEAARALQAARRELSRLQSDEKSRLQRLDMLRYQAREIHSLDLVPGLEEELERERSLLETAQGRLLASREIHELLYAGEPSCLGWLTRCQERLAELARFDPATEAELKKLSDLRYQLEEIAYQMRDYADRVSFHPERLEEIQERLAQIAKARRKYGATVEEILAYADSIAAELEELEGGESRAEELAREVGRLEVAYREAARLLSSKRNQDAKKLRRRVQEELRDLNMEGTLFEVHLEAQPDRVSERGIDRVEFRLSANPGEAPARLAEIASGGELSRVVLALKSLASVDSSSRTLVFDEVDAGIGGRVAARVGSKLAALAREHQVFCVTHLPQIACRAERHFHVGKTTARKRTVVRLKQLETLEERVDEIARMLAGEKITSTTRRQALEMLQQKTGASPERAGFSA